jgi:hypothetical protein
MAEGGLAGCATLRFAGARGEVYFGGEFAFFVKLGYQFIIRFYNFFRVYPIRVKPKNGS